MRKKAMSMPRRRPACRGKSAAWRPTGRRRTLDVPKHQAYQGGGVNLASHRREESSAMKLTRKNGTRSMKQAGTFLTDERDFLARVVKATRRRAVNKTRQRLRAGGKAARSSNILLKQQIIAAEAYAAPAAAWLVSWRVENIEKRRALDLPRKPLPPSHLRGHSTTIAPARRAPPRRRAVHGITWGRALVRCLGGASAHRRYRPGGECHLIVRAKPSRRRRGIDTNAWQYRQ